MAYTAADLQRLDDAIARGQRRVTYKDRTIEYATMDELRKARDFVAAQVRKRPRRAFGVFMRKGT